jgi:outer membrane protein
MVLNRVKIIVIIVAFLSLKISYSQNNILLNLDEAVQMALSKNSDIIISNYQIAATKFALREAKGNFLPKVYLNAQYNRNINPKVLYLSESNTATKLGSENEYSSSLNVTFPLFSAYNSSNKKIALTQLDLQNEGARGVRQSIINSTKKIYFNYLIALELVKAQENLLKNVEETTADIKKRVKKGTLTDYDLASAKVQEANAKNNLIEAQSNLIPSSNNLKNILGLDINDDLELTDSIKLIDDEMVFEDKSELLIEKNSRLKQLEKEIELNQKKVQLVKSSYFPTVDVVGNYNYQTQANNFNVFNYNWVNTSLVGMQIRFNVFNGNITKQKVEQSKIAQKIAEEKREYASREYQMQFKELRSQLEFSQQKINVQKENMNLTAVALAISKKRYEFGVGTFLEVSNAELMYTQARLNWLKAILEYKSAYYDFELLIGKDEQL